MNRTPSPGRFVGIDVSQRTLHVADSLQQAVSTVPNDEWGHRQLVVELTDATLVVFEATGTYHPVLRPQPTTSTGLRQSERPARQDRPGRCAPLGLVCRAHATSRL
jgi:hypothetical protein